MFRVLILLGWAALAIAPGAMFAETSGVARASDSHGGASAGVLIPAGFKPADFARALLAETNRVRRAHGQWPLRPRRALDAAADDQAAFMALTMRVQHESLLRGQATPADRVSRHGVHGSLIAENVAFTSLNAAPEETSVDAIAAALVEQWLNSPGHRANILNPRLTHFGGSVRLARLAGQWSAYGVQVFLGEGRSSRG